MFTWLTQDLKTYFSLLPSLENIIYGDQARKEVLDYVWLTVCALDLWNHSVVILLEIHLLAGSTPPLPPQYTHQFLGLWEELSVGNANWKLSWDYVNYLLLYHSAVQGVLYYLDVPHNFTFVYNILDMYLIR